jgi:hypothetical protein
MSTVLRRVGLVLAVVLVAGAGVTLWLSPRHDGGHGRVDAKTIHVETPEQIRWSDQHAGDPAWLALPDRVPGPQARPADENCLSGVTLALTMSDETVVAYGVCDRPAALDGTVCRMIHQPEHCWLNRA